MLVRVRALPLHHNLHLLGLSLLILLVSHVTQDCFGKLSSASLLYAAFMCSADAVSAAAAIWVLCVVLQTGCGAQ